MSDHWKKYLTGQAEYLKRQLRRLIVISLFLVVGTLISEFFNKPGTALGVMRDLSFFVSLVAVGLTGNIFGRYRQVLKQMRQS